jgi:hypothetical protein
MKQEVRACEIFVPYENVLQSYPKLTLNILSGVSASKLRSGRP